MKLYLVSLLTGLLAGVLYSVLNVRSPAPPVIALLGLLGMLVGEQIVPTAKRLASGEPVTMSWFRAECVPKIMGAPSDKPDSAVVASGAMQRDS
ncbi:DUF1427 family protein [Herbaspirillum sp. GCM10030257]|uniref:DUF1427 family protein n=1 Tax=Herbaspirillum sp. GCM10030257 TaxID=3273393 RepID=UPI00360CB877